MKKTFRLFAVLLLSLIAVFTLSSCRALEERKQKRVTYEKEIQNYRDAAELTYRGEKYVIAIPRSKTGKGGQDYYLTAEANQIVYVTSDDVPVLLSRLEGESAQASKNGYYLLAFGNLYVRKDLADTFDEKTFLNTLCFSTYSGIEKCDPQIGTALAEIVSSPKMDQASIEKFFDGNNPEIMYFWLYDETLSVADYYSSDSITVYWDRDDDGRMILTGNDDEEARYYVIPEKFRPLFLDCFSRAFGVYVDEVECASYRDLLYD